MKYEDIRKLFENATDEQVKSLLDINSADITKALGKQKDAVETMQTDLAEANEALKNARDMIKTLEESKGDTEALQKQIDDYKRAEEARKAAETAAQLRKAVEARFDAVVGERKFLHEFVRKGVLDEFEKALADEANKGKGDKDIFETLTKDMGYFSSQNPPVNMGNLGNIDSETDKEKFQKMSLYDQMLFAKSHPEQAEEFMK